MKPSDAQKFKVEFTYPPIGLVLGPLLSEKRLCAPAPSPGGGGLAQAADPTGVSPMLTLSQAQAILAAALSHAELGGFKPLAIAVLDARGAQKAFAAQDGTSLKRGEIALGKAHGAVALGIGSRALHRMALDRPYFVEADPRRGRRGRRRCRHLGRHLRQ
jgi:hypothetical protein